MWYFAYFLILSAAAPFGALFLRLRPRHRPLIRRFRPAVPRAEFAPLWLHACSVGEVRTAVPFLNALHAHWPSVPLVLTVSTQSGRDVAQNAVDSAAITWLPFDHPWAIRSFVRRLKPRALLILETELWPALIRETANASVPVAILNGRLSDKHFARYIRWRAFTRSFMPKFELLCVQNAEYRDRFIRLGARPDRVHVVGNAKFDGAPTPISPADRDSLRADCSFEPNAPVLVFGSTRPGDEQRAADCWRILSAELPQLRLVLAPRHLDRIEDAIKPFEDPVALRSKPSQSTDSPILCVDTFGELARFYAIATVAVVGGSFDPEIQGHNPIEPAALGTPTIFGPHMRNFADPSRLLLEVGAALEVQDTNELIVALRDLLRNEMRRAEMAAAAQRMVHENRGAIERTLALLKPLIGDAQ